MDDISDTYSFNTLCTLGRKVRSPTPGHHPTSTLLVSPAGW